MKHELGYRSAVFDDGIRFTVSVYLSDDDGKTDILHIEKTLK